MVTSIKRVKHAELTSFHYTEAAWDAWNALSMHALILQGLLLTTLISVSAYGEL